MTQTDPPNTAQRRQTTIYINLATVWERSSEMILPSVYAFVARSFNSSPSQLGMLTLSRSLTQALMSPFGGLAGYLYHRGIVIALGCTIWSLCALMFAASTSVLMGLPIWSLAGVGLALIVPSCQSLLADLYEANERGRAFGLMMACFSLGGMFGTLVAANIAEWGSEWHMSGWRVAFVLACVLSALVAVLNYYKTYDPREGSSGAMASTMASSANTLERETRHPLHILWREIRAVLRIRSFIVIVIQGIFGSIPWAALVFLQLYLQLLSMSAAVAAILVAIFMGGIAIGGIVGGYLGDAAESRWPNHGRVIIAQISVASGIPMSVLIFRLLPTDGTQLRTVLLHGVVLLIGAIIKAWPAPACNNPVFAEIVPKEHRSMVYSFDRCLENALASCSAPLVGLLAERAFGFSGAATPTDDPAIDSKNARALGNALLVFTVFPWGIVLVLYFLLHATLWRDKIQAALAEERADVVASNGEEYELSEGEHVVLLPSLRRENVRTQF